MDVTIIYVKRATVLEGDQASLGKLLGLSEHEWMNALCIVKRDIQAEERSGVSTLTSMKLEESSFHQSCHSSWEGWIGNTKRLVVYV